MKRESGSRRHRREGVTAVAPGKTRITIRIDDDVLSWFRRQVRSSGGSYQTLINLSLREYIAREPLEATLRLVVREELARFEGRLSPHAYGYESPPAMVADDADAPYGAYLARRTRRRRSGKS